MFNNNVSPRNVLKCSYPSFSSYVLTVLLQCYMSFEKGDVSFKDELSTIISLSTLTSSESLHLLLGVAKGDLSE